MSKAKEEYYIASEKYNTYQKGDYIALKAYKYIEELEERNEHLEKEIERLTEIVNDMLVY